MTDLNKLDELLAPAIRQYRHNNSDALVIAYDRRETERIVSSLLKRTGLDREKVLGFIYHRMINSEEYTGQEILEDIEEHIKSRQLDQE